MPRKIKVTLLQFAIVFIEFFQMLMNAFSGLQTAHRFVPTQLAALLAAVKQDIS